MKFLKPLLFTALTVVTGLVNHPILWSGLITGLIWDIYYTKKSVLTTIQEKDSAMGKRLIEGMKALTDLARNAFDHLKSQKAQIDKLQSRVSDNHVVSQRNRHIDQRESSEKKVVVQEEAPYKITKSWAQIREERAQRREENTRKKLEKQNVRDTQPKTDQTNTQ